MFKGMIKKLYKLGTSVIAFKIIKKGREPRLPKFKQ